MISKIDLIIKENIKKFLYENSVKFNVISITDKNEIKEIKDVVYNMMVESYSKTDKKNMINIHSSNHLAKSAKLIKIVVNNDEIIAASCYMNRLNEGYKMICIGCNQTDIGKLALQEIIKDDIKNYNLWFWAEVSGAVEHYFKKHNGYPIPSEYVSEILFNNVQIKDEVHYSRTFSDGSELVKCVYGFRNKEFFDKVVADATNYQNFIDRVNSLPGDKVLNEFYSKYPPNVYKAIYILENIYSFYEDGFCEMMPKWVEMIIWSKKILTEYDDDNLLGYVDIISFLLDLDVLEIHDFI